MLVQTILIWLRKDLKLSRPTSKSIIKVRGFHGLTNFYRRFIKDFNTLTTALTKIVKKFMCFKWCIEESMLLIY
jgi:hypothetical protein